MKTNEAPEKIYLQQLQNNEIYNHWYKLKLNNDFIEYAHVDSFIDKAWDWIENNLLSSNQQDKSRLYFEQFKNYIKGE